MADFVTLNSGLNPHRGTIDALSHLGNEEHRHRVLNEIGHGGIPSYDDVWE